MRPQNIALVVVGSVAFTVCIITIIVLLVRHYRPRSNRFEGRLEFIMLN